MQDNRFAYTSFEPAEIPILMLALIQALKRLRLSYEFNTMLESKLANMIAGIGCRRKSLGGELTSAIDAQNVAFIAIAVFQKQLAVA